VNKKAVGDKLKALRVAQFPRKSEFAKKTKIQHGAIDDVENGDIFLRIDRLKTWVETCGSTLPRFFAELEPEPQGPTVEVTIKKAHKKDHERLEDLLNEGGNAAFLARESVTTFHSDHVVRKRRRDK